MKQFMISAVTFLSALSCSAQDTRTATILRENAAADERRLQKLKDEGRTPNTPSNNRSGVGKDLWMQQQAAGVKAREEYKAAAELVREGYANDDRPVYNRREHIPGKPDNYVEVTYSNGATYQGTVRNIKYHGKGTLVSSKGDIYDGDWVNDKHHGNGKMYSVEDHSWYVGEFKKGKKSGQGKLSSSWGEYIGEFENDEMNGPGTYNYTDGSVKTGIWKDGYIWQGKVKEVKDGKLLFEAVVDNRLWNGECTQYFRDGSKIIGTYKKNILQGPAKKIFPNGDVYEGSFKDDLYDGKGKLTLENGTVLEGNFSKGTFIN